MGRPLRARRDQQVAAPFQAHADLDRGSHLRIGRPFGLDAWGEPASAARKVHAVEGRPRPSPLQHREFFSGTWTGEGELRLVGPCGWLRRPQRFRYHTRVRWITEARSEFTDVFEFESGRRLALPFVSEIVDERRFHVESPDMPGGADMQLSEDGYTYSPYVVLARVGPLRFRLRCTDVNVIDSEGLIHDRVEMRWLGLRTATMTMTIRVNRSDTGA